MNKELNSKEIINELAWKILIVDDDNDVHTVTSMALRRLEFDGKPLELIHAYTAKEAQYMLIKHKNIAVILLDVVMESDTAGLDLVRFIRQTLKDENMRIVIRTGNPGKAPEDSVTVEYDINDYRGKVELTAQSLRTVIITGIRSYKALVAIKGLNKEIDETQKELIYTLGEIAESRSFETGNHVERVSEMSSLLASKLGFSDKEVAHLRLAASMHDLGKLAIEDSVLNKPGKLTPEEYDIVKQHTLFGYEILKNSERELLKLAAIIALEHHENVDGSGYPMGKTAKEIHPLSKVVALIDVYDALAIKRIYKKAWPADEIYNYINEQKSIKFDPTIVDVFFQHINEIEELRKNLIKKL